MKSFEKNLILKQPIEQSLLQTIRMLGEYRGKEALYREQSPQVLDTLTQSAIIQSAESSNRIEGVVAENQARLKALLIKKAKPKNRPEQEIAGYRDVLKTIHASYDQIPFTPNIVLQFHRDLFKFTTAGGGKWKSTDNDIIETSPEGKSTVRFKPVPAWQTKEYMKTLHDSFNETVSSNKIEPLLAIPAYVLDFLCVHPFLDGNGRMARLLTLLLLYQSGYAVGRFISLERIVEENKEGYYDALYQSSQGWHEGRHSLLPWWNYFLGVMLLAAYREFEERVGLVQTARGAKGALVLSALKQMPPRFTISQLMEKCPTVGIDYIRKVLRSQRDAGKLKTTGRGPDAAWLKVENV
jgi:Fic family protein